MIDMSDTIEPKSDQVNADSLLAGPRTIIVRKVTVAPGTEQPVSVFFDGDEGKPYMPGKSMRRVMVMIWGPDASAYVGRSMTLYRDPAVTWGGMEVGGIRISHMSDITEKMTVVLTATKKTRKPFTVAPMPVATQPRRTLGHFLDGLEAELRGAADYAAVAAIVEREDVRKAQDVAKNGMAQRLADMVDAARERVAPAADDGWPGPAEDAAP